MSSCPHPFSFHGVVGLYLVSLQLHCFFHNLASLQVGPFFVSCLGYVVSFLLLTGHNTAHLSRLAAVLHIVGRYLLRLLLMTGLPLICLHALLSQ